MTFSRFLFNFLVVGGSVASAIYSGVSGFNDVVVFNFDGSSSMRFLMEYLLDLYSKDKTISFNISAIGSNSGLKKLLNGSSQFALVSHDVSNFHNSDSYKTEWSNKKIKSIPLAKEAIVLLYYPPKDCKKELTLSSSNVKKLYSVFSGHKAPDAGSFNGSLKDLMDDNNDNTCDIQIIPWVKSTGPSKSGTARAFVENPLLQKKCSSINSGSEKASSENNGCSEWFKKVKEGYGNDFQVNFVSESTNLHWDIFKNNITPGSMTYLPSHFVFQNWDLIQSYGLKFAKYKKDDSTTAVAITKDNSQLKDNEWQRSFNLVYSTSDISTNNNKKQFIEFLVQNSSKLSALNLIPISYKLKNGATASDAREIDITKGDIDENNEKSKSK